MLSLLTWDIGLLLGFSLKYRMKAVLVLALKKGEN